MDDPAGSTKAADSGPNNLPGFVQGSVTFLPTAGKQGSGAISLAGAGYIRVPFPNDAKNDGTGIAIPQGNMTFSMWFKTSASVPGGLQAVEGTTWGSGFDCIVGNGTGSTLQYNAWSEVNMTGLATVNDGNWHLMTYVLDETNGFFTYIDGTPTPAPRRRPPIAAKGAAASTGPRSTGLAMPPTAVSTPTTSLASSMTCACTTTSSRRPR